MPLSSRLQWPSWLPLTNAGLHPLLQPLKFLTRTTCWASQRFLSQSQVFPRLQVVAIQFRTRWIRFHLSSKLKEQILHCMEPMLLKQEQSTSFSLLQQAWAAWPFSYLLPSLLGIARQEPSLQSLPRWTFHYLLSLKHSCCLNRICRLSAGHILTQSRLKNLILWL